MATINTQFSVGDTAFVVVFDKSLTPAICAACNSTGKVTLAGQQYTCPACNGRKVTGPKSKIVVPMTIKRIIAAKCASKCQIQYEGTTEDYGVQTFPESQVFVSGAAAQASIGV